MSSKVIDEARRQTQICNACRYCEGYCAVFPRMFRWREFSSSEITHLANLCHNCRGCHYACQYSDPHEFAINLPAALADVREQSWRNFAWPRGFGMLFERAGVVIALTLVATFAVMFALVRYLPPTGGQGFYAFMSHTLMVTIFIPAFVLPLFAMGVAVRRYWRFVGGGRISMRQLREAMGDIAVMRNLQGGHGDGCNFENDEAFSKWRARYHQATLWGFAMCFASTSVATVLHYVFALEAPYSWYSLPKLLGVPGGVLLCIGTAGLAVLKLNADPALGAKNVWGGEMAFVLLLFAVSASGLALYAATGTAAVAWLLPVHLGTVLAFFVVTPYSKMVHGAYRTAALIINAKRSGEVR